MKNFDELVNKDVVVDLSKICCGDADVGDADVGDADVGDADVGDTEIGRHCQAPKISDSDQELDIPPCPQIDL